MQNFLKHEVEFYFNFMTFKNSTCNLTQNKQINKKLKILLQKFIKYKILQTFSQFYFHLLPFNIEKLEGIEFSKLFSNSIALTKVYIKIICSCLTTCNFFFL